MGLILLRHTRPDIAPCLCYGASDIGLAESFEGELAGLLLRLPEVTGIATSPLARCQTLAGRIGAVRGLAPVTDPRLSEMDFGRWEMQPWDAIPRAQLDAWAADLMTARPHGGESVAMLRTRVAAFLSDWDQLDTTVLAVTHAGVIRAALDLRGQPGAWESAPAHGALLVLPAAPADARRRPD